MRLCSKIIYGISLVLITILLVIFQLYPHTGRTMLRTDSSYEIITDYTFETYENKAAPIGITQEYSFTLENIPLYNACVQFNLIHQKVVMQ